MPGSAQSGSSPTPSPPPPAEEEALPSDEVNEQPGEKNRGERQILILDDDPEVLVLYTKILSRLPSRPRVRVADNAAQALALLEAEPFELFITDLRMPKIDGFQVLLSARRRLPDLKTVVMTAMGNQQNRARAYDSGIDLFVEKPTTPAEIRIFGECVEGLLQQGEKERGFRGIQSKSLMDLVQMECLSQNSTTLKITSGALEGRVWIVKGNIIDAEAMGKRGEEAFRFLFAWKTGNFESAPGDPTRERTIFASCESLLLTSAQALDENLAGEAKEETARDREFTQLATVHGVQSLLLIRKDGECDLWSLENAEGYVTWTRRVVRDLRGIGEMLKAGTLIRAQAAGGPRALVLVELGERQLLAGMDPKMTIPFLRKAACEFAAHLGGESRAAAGETPLAAAAQETARRACGTYTVSAAGKIIDSTLPPSFPRVIMEVIAKVILSAFSTARELESPLTELAVDYTHLELRARDAGPGAILFITPREF